MHQSRHPASAALIALTCVLGSGCAKPVGAQAAAPASAVVSVPFVGCAEDGQAGPRAAPTGAAKAVRTDAATAQKLAFYAARDTAGVLAPRGWQCFGSYGSNGASLFVVPQPIASADVLSPTWAGLAGPGVQVSQSTGDTSGRFTVAAVIARVFPAHMAFAQSVIAEGIEPASQFPSGPYPSDTMAPRGGQTAEFTTPPNAVGLGTAQTELKADGDPIKGVAILTGETPDLLLAAVRLSPDMSGLAPTIIAQLERDNPAGGASTAVLVGASESSALDVTRAFYTDLGAGDGTQAATLVVPAKRQSGPLSASALTGFYGAMSQPLVLTAATQASDGSVSVRYKYTYAGGKSCDGAATVLTTVSGGARLIASIHALNGC